MRTLLGERSKGEHLTGARVALVELISEVVERVAKATLRRDQFQTSIKLWKELLGV